MRKRAYLSSTENPSMVINADVLNVMAGVFSRPQSPKPFMVRMWIQRDLMEPLHLGPLAP